MATGVTFGDAVHRGESTVWETNPRVSESLTTTTSAATTATTNAGEYIRVVSSAAVWVTVAASPTAAAGTDFLVGAGAEFVLFDPVGGNKVAVIDA